MSSNVGKQIEKYIELEQYPKARKLIMKALKEEPSSHWLITELSSTYYEERQYLKALMIIKKAYRISPDCPLVLWHYAGSLEEVGKRKEAIDIYKGLLIYDVTKVCYRECWEGIRWSRSLLNDCRYRIGVCYFHMNDYRNAKKYIKQHIANRSFKTPSIYSLDEVNADLKKVIKAAGKK